MHLIYHDSCVNKEILKLHRLTNKKAIATHNKVNVNTKNNVHTYDQQCIQYINEQVLCILDILPQFSAQQLIRAWTWHTTFDWLTFYGENQ